MGLVQRCLSHTCIGSLVAENDWKQQREATNSGCPSYIGFKKRASVDSARILPL